MTLDTKSLLQTIEGATLTTATDIYQCSRQRKFPMECATCIWRHACCSGCEVLAERSGTTNMKSPHCAIIRKILPLLLILEGRKVEKYKLRKEVGYEHK